MQQLLEKIAKAPAAVKFGGLAGAVVVLTALNFFLVISDIETKITQLTTQQNTLNQQLAEKREIADNLNDRRREMELLEQKLSEALTELPEKKEIDELLAQLNDVGRKSGLEIARVEPQAEKAETFFARIPIKMTVSGNYHEIAMFLQEVSNLRRIVNVNELKLSNGTTKGDKVMLSSEFMATTFRFVDAATEPKGAQKGAAAPAKGGAPK